MLNVYKPEYAPWRCLSNWKHNIKIFFNRYKYAKQRAKQGFCDSDTWELSDYWLEVMIESLKRFRDIHNSYPGDMTMEEWDAYLNEIISHLTIAHDGIKNKFEDDFHKYMEEHRAKEFNKKDEKISITYEFPHNDPLIVQLWRKEQSRINKERQYHLAQGLDMLKNRYFEIWW